MNELGYYFLAKETDHHQPERALKYLNASADRGDIYGYNNLGLVYSNGLGGVDPDAETALDWFAKASAGGHPYAPVNIGRLHYNGKLGDGGPDYAQAVAWYDQGLERGDAWGGANAAWIILNKDVPDLDAADAAVRAAKAAALRNEEAAARARQLLGALDARTLTRAAQRLVNEMGADVAVDGAYGGETRGALEKLGESVGWRPDLSSSEARVLSAAYIYWRKNPLRLDLY